MKGKAQLYLTSIESFSFKDWSPKLVFEEADGAPFPPLFINAPFTGI